MGKYLQSESSPSPLRFVNRSGACSKARGVSVQCLPRSTSGLGAKAGMDETRSPGGLSEEDILYRTQRLLV